MEADAALQLLRWLDTPGAVSIVGFEQDASSVAPQPAAADSSGSAALLGAAPSVTSFPTRQRKDVIVSTADGEKLPRCVVCATDFADAAALRAHAQQSRRHRFNLRLRARLGSSERAAKYALSREDFALWMRSCSDPRASRVLRREEDGQEDEHSLSSSESESPSDDSDSTSDNVTNDEPRIASLFCDDALDWRVSSADASERFLRLVVERESNEAETAWVSEDHQLRAKRAPRIVLRVNEPESDKVIYVSLWRCMFDNSDATTSEALLVELRLFVQESLGASALYTLLQRNQKAILRNRPPVANIPGDSELPCLWAVLLIGGGSFAGGIFCGRQILKHRVVRRYTVRKKQGGSQGSQDASGGAHSQAQSAGAHIRRTMTIKLASDVLEILHSWADVLVKSRRIFIAAPGRSYRQMLFGTRANGSVAARELRVDSPLVLAGSSTDSLLSSVRTVPFTSFKPSLLEVTRCMQELSRVVDENAPVSSFDASLDASRESPLEVVLREQARDFARRKALQRETSTPSPTLRIGVDRIHASDDQNVVQTPETPIDLLLHAIRDSETTDIAAIAELTANYSNYVLSASDVREGTNPVVDAVELNRADVVDILLSHDCIRALHLNRRREADGLTPLHSAARHGNAAIVERLLSLGADPTLTTSERPFRTAYDLAAGSQLSNVRNAIRAYAARHPDAWPWQRAAASGVAPLSNDLAATKAEQKAAKRRRKAAAAKTKKREENCLRAFEAAITAVIEERTSRESQLSDRERRALAAERRALKSQPPDFGASKLACGAQLSHGSCDSEVPLVPFLVDGRAVCSAACVRNLIGQVHGNFN